MDVHPGRFGSTMRPGEPFVASGAAGVAVEARDVPRDIDVDGGSDGDTRDWPAVTLPSLASLMPPFIGRNAAAGTVKLAGRSISFLWMNKR